MMRKFSFETIQETPQPSNDLSTFWTGVGAVGGIAVAAITIIAIYVTYINTKSEIKANKDLVNKQKNEDILEKKAQIISALKFEIYSNIVSLKRENMLEIRLSTIAFERFNENLHLFNLRDNKDLYSRFDQLYKNFYFYNHIWQKFSINYNLLKEVRVRIFIYYLYLFGRFGVEEGGHENTNYMIGSISKILENVKKLDEDNNQGNILKTLNEVNSKSTNIFFEKEYLRLGLLKVFKDTHKDNREDKLKENILDLMYIYLWKEYELHEAMFDDKEIDSILKNFNN
ncbi:MAG: hypothetical protein ABIM99_01255 [Candidatus Dojkabacteria bacterium]